MTHLEELIAGLADAIPDGMGGPDDGIRVEAMELDLTLPVETRLDASGQIRACLPRGRLATGHDVPHSRMALRFHRREDA